MASERNDSGIRGVSRILLGGVQGLVSNYTSTRMRESPLFLFFLYIFFITIYVKEDKGYMYVASNANTRNDPKIIKKQIGI